MWISMSARPRHHTQNRWGGNRARMLAPLLGAGERQHEWREPRWKHSQRQGWVPRRRRSIEPTPHPWARPPYCPDDWRRGMNRQPTSQRARGRDWKSRVLPRRGPPVAAIPVPRWPRQEEMCGRQPRGFKPRGTLRGGPERSAEDPQRNPRGGLC